MNNETGRKTSGFKKISLQKNKKNGKKKTFTHLKDLFFPTNDFHSFDVLHFFY